MTSTERIDSGLLAAWASDIGKVRTENHDRVGGRGDVVAVADGVGSTEGAGEAAEAVLGYVLDHLAEARDEAELGDVVRAADRALAELVTARVMPAAAATTLTAALRIGDDVLVVNVGDSPAWVLGSGGARLVTQPHQRWDPFADRYVLLSALGPRTLRNVSVVRVPITGPTRLVLASDGVLLPGESMESPSALAEAAAGSAAAAVAAMLRRVLAGPASDNVTVAVLDVMPVT